MAFLAGAGIGSMLGGGESKIKPSTSASMEAAAQGEGDPFKQSGSPNLWQSLLSNVDTSRRGNLDTSIFKDLIF